MILSVVVVNVVISSVVVVVVVVLNALQYDAQITKLNESFISHFFIILRSSDIKNFYISKTNDENYENRTSVDGKEWLL